MKERCPVSTAKLPGIHRLPLPPETIATVRSRFRFSLCQPEKTGKVFIAGLLLGAVLSLLKMLQDGSAWERFLYLSAYIRQVFNDKKVEKYYVLSRDGTGCVIPLGACFCAGAILILVL